MSIGSNLQAENGLSVLHLGGLSADEPDSTRWAQALGAITAELGRVSKPVDLLVLSGGLARSGDYKHADGLVARIIDAGIDSGAFRELPLIIPVPGESDITRQDRKSAAVRTLHRLWPDIADEFWEETAPDEWLMVQLAFAEYEQWATAYGAALPSRVPGLLPGDGSAIYTADQRRIGILTLNTCFRRLSEASAAADAVIGLPQLNAACGGDATAWLRQHDVVLLVSSDPLERFDEASRELLRSVQPPGGPPVIHLCGSSGAGDGKSPTQAGLLSLPGLPFTSSSPEDIGGTGFALLSLRQHDGTVQVERTAYMFTPSSGGLELRPGPAEQHSVQAADEPAPETAAPAEQDEPDSPSAAQLEVASSPQPIDSATTRQLLEDLASGGSVLLLGSTSSLGLRTRAGNPLSTLAELRARLLQIVAPEATATDDGLSMAELLAQARAKHGQTVDDLLTEGFSAAWSGPPTELSWLYEAPWEIVYTLDLSTAPAKLAASGSLTTELAVVDGMHEFTPPAFDRLQVIQVNGNASRPEEVDLVVPGSSHAGTYRDQWFGRLAADLVSHPVVVLADSSDDYDLWAYLLQRVAHDEQENKDRPTGYLVCPDLGVTRRLRLPAYGMKWIPSTVADFVSRYLAPQNSAVSRGRKVLARRRNAAANGQGIKLISGILTSLQPGQKRFLLGQEPSWGDVHDGVAARLSITERLRREIGDLGEPRTVTIIKGRAGTGKTTSLMRLALDLHKEGLQVGWIDRTIERRRRDLEKDAESLALDVIFVDGADIFGGITTEFLERLTRNGATAVIASIRNTRYDALVVPLPGHGIVSHDFRLTDDDIRRLIQTLFKHNVPGNLRKYKTPESRREQFKVRSDRELLVGMMEVTRGGYFLNLIKDEYQDLPERERLLYGAISFAMFTFESAHVYENELLQILGVRPPFTPWVASLRHLIGKNLVTRNDAGQVRTYNKTVADRIVTTVLKRSPEDLARIYGDSLTYFAASAHKVRDPNNRDRRMMIRLLSHSLMTDLRLPVATARAVYDSVASWLHEDFHYWLQRGAYEVERGDLEMAKNFLDQAKSCEGGEKDHFVLTEWGSMQLKQAIEAPTNPSSVELAMDAIETLSDVARLRQGDSPHTFAVLARDGSRWLSTDAVMPQAERVEVAGRIMEIIKLGRQQCAGNREFIQTARDADKKLRQILFPPNPRPGPELPIV